MAAEENKAVVRRELEEIFNHTGNLDVADEIYARDYIGHQPAPDDIRGVGGLNNSPPFSAAPSPIFEPPSRTR